MLEVTVSCCVLANPRTGFFFAAFDSSSLLATATHHVVPVQPAPSDISGGCSSVAHCLAILQYSILFFGVKSGFGGESTGLYLAIIGGSIGGAYGLFASKSAPFLELLSFL